ncbi:hypothetical protein [Scytonema hofmannii]
MQTQWQVCDSNDSNGTYINGVRLQDARFCTQAIAVTFPFKLKKS